MQTQSSTTAPGHRRNMLGIGIGACVLASAGLFIAGFEGRVNRTYTDIAGVPTACYGHTGADLRPGQTFTDAQCSAMLATDVQRHAFELDCVTQPVTDNQAAALISLAYNIGTGAFCRSTLVRMLNAGDEAGAAGQFGRWVYVKGRPVRGLAARRAKERALFMTPDAPPSPPGPDVRSKSGMTAGG